MPGNKFLDDQAQAEKNLEAFLKKKEIEASRVTSFGPPSLSPAGSVLSRLTNIYQSDTPNDPAQEETSAMEKDIKTNAVSTPQKEYMWKRKEIDRARSTLFPLIECDVLRSFSPPNVKNLNKLKLHSNQAYVRTNKGLYYVNKSKNECVEIKLSAEKLKAFDRNTNPSIHPAIVSEDQLEQIVKITGMIPPFNEENNSSRKKIILELKNEIKAYDEKNEIDPQRLNNIIRLCDEYIATISPRYRKDIFSDAKEKYFKDNFDKAFPNVHLIFHLQRQAVMNLYMPEVSEKNGPQFAKSRWKMVSDLVDANPKPVNEKKVATKPANRKILGPQYWKEFRFKGNMHIHEWIKMTGELNDLVCFSEMKNEASYMRGTIFYQDQSKIKNIALHYSKEGLKDSKGQLISSSGNYVFNSKGELFYIPILGYGLIIQNEQGEAVVLHHSSLVAGKPVSCAGTISISNGKIEEITNTSGHYKPSEKDFSKMLRKLVKTGVDLSETMIVVCTGRDADKAYKGYSNFVAGKTIGFHEFTRKANI